MMRHACLSMAVVLAAACEAGSDSVTPAPALEWADPVKAASGRAYRGPWRMNDSEFLYVDDPAVALSGDHTYLAWVDNADQNVFFQRFDSEATAQSDKPVNVSGSGEIFSWLPRVAVEGQNVIVAWQEILFTGGSHGGEILLARSSDGGRTFGDPVNLSNTTAGAGKGRLTRQRWDNGSLDVVITDGRVHVAWTEYEGALRVASSSDDGRSFSEPLHVTGDDDSPARAPSLAVGPDGRIWLAWTVGDSAQADIRLAFSDDPPAGFSEPRRIRPSRRHADSPALGVSANGRVHLVWTESERAPFRDSHIVHASDVDGDGAFETWAVISGDTMAAYPQLAVSRDRVMVSWERAEPNERRPFGIGYALSNDGGQHFSEPARVSATMREDYGKNGGNQGLLMRKLDLAEDGRVALGHATFLTGESSAVWLLHGHWRSPSEQ